MKFNEVTGDDEFDDKGFITDKAISHMRRVLAVIASSESMAASFESANHHHLVEDIKETIDELDRDRDYCVYEDF